MRSAALPEETVRRMTAPPAQRGPDAGVRPGHRGLPAIDLDWR